MTIKGPFYKSSQTNGSFGIKYFRTWYTQDRPYLRPLPFSFRKYVVTQGTALSVDTLGQHVSGSHVIESRNKAYSRFIGNLGGSASLGVSLAEARQSIDMIGSRATQLLQFTHAVRKFRFGEAAKILKVPPKVFDSRIKPRLKKSSGKDVFADNWLEFHFGWGPLVSDIGKAIEILVGELPPFLVRGSGTVSDSRVKRLDSHWSEIYTAEWHNIVTTRISAMVRVSNPNLRLAQQLGFVNPAVLAYELVPFSFLEGWFGNVQDILSSYTDLAGIEVIWCRTTTFVNGKESLSIRNAPGYPVFSLFGAGDTVWCDRTLEIPAPVLQFKLPDRLSLSRGLTAIALLCKAL